MNAPRSVLRSVVSAVLASSAGAQCLDWSSDFPVPGQGILGSRVGQSVVFDDGGGAGAQIYVCGVYQAGGANVSSVARWNGSAWSAVGGFGPNGDVRALAVFDDGSGPALYAGGDDFVIGGVPNLRLAKWVPGSGWVALADQPNSFVSALATIDLGAGSRLYVGGHFGSIGATSASRVAMWDGATWSALGAGFNEDVMTFAAHDAGSGLELYAGGYFGFSGATPVGKLARWNGSAWTMPPVGQILGEVVYALESYDDGGGARLYVGGDGMPLRVMGPSGYTLPWGTNDRLVWDFLPHDDGSGTKLYACGGFVYPGLKPLGNVLAWDGSSWLQLGVGIEPTTQSDFDKPRSLVSYTDSKGTGLYVFGGFTEAGGKPSRNVARWGEACTAPAIVTQPVSVTAAYPSPVSFGVTASGTGPLTYLWTHDGNPITGGTGVSGWDTPTLVMTAWDWDARGDYRCDVTGPLGSVSSDTVVLTVPAGGITGDPVVVTKVAVSGEPMPGHPASSFVDPTAADQSNDGSVVLVDQERVFVHDGVSTTRVIGIGDQAPGLATDVRFGAVFGAYSAADAGRFAVQYSLTGPGTSASNRRSLWFHEAGVTTLVARAGNAPVGGGSGQVFHANGFEQRLSSNGLLAYAASVTAGSSSTWRGIWGWDPVNGSTLWARTGVTAPGTSETFTVFEGYGTLNALGQMPFIALTSSGYSLWVASAAGPTPVVRIGDALPGSPWNEVVVSLWSVHQPINDVGEIAFGVQTQGDGGYTGQALVRWSTSGLVTLLRSGDAAPGASPGAVFSQFGPVAMNDSGAILLFATLANTGTGPQQGYWFVDPQGAPTDVALNPPYVLPGMPPNPSFQRVGVGALDDHDRVLVNLEYSHGTPLFGWTPTHGTFSVAMPGSQVELAPGDHATLGNALLQMYDGGVSGSKLSSSFDGGGGVCFSASFVDGRQGTFLARYQQLFAQYSAPGTAFCAGDGTASACPCANVGATGHGCASSRFASGARLEGSGSAAVTDDTLRLDVEALPNSSCLFFQGTTRAAGGAGIVFGDGLRCAAGSVLRLGIRAVSGNARSLGHGVGTDAPISSTGLVTNAGTRTYQVWYRNSAAFCTASTFNLSNGYEVQWGP